MESDGSQQPGSVLSKINPAHPGVTDGEDGPQIVEGSCECVEYAVADGRRGVVLEGCA